MVILEPSCIGPQAFRATKKHGRLRDMADLHYTHPDLVALYDVFNGWSPDRTFYADLAGDSPVSVLEAGCGTGLIARAMAAAGHDVTGLDPAQPMLDFASAAPDGDKVRWVCGDLPSFTGGPFHLIFMTGHAFQCLLRNEDILAAFMAVAHLLGQDGTFVFETRNPMARAWEKWVPEHTTITRQSPDGCEVTEWHDLVEVTGEMVSFTSVYQFPDQRLTSHSTLRFASEVLIRDLANQAGLQVRSVFGDWDRNAVSDESPELIFQMTRA